MYDVVVNGGGLVGLAFALDLAQKRKDLYIAILDGKFKYELNQTISDKSEISLPEYVLPTASTSTITNNHKEQVSQCLKEELDDRIYAISPQNVQQLESLGVHYKNLRYGPVCAMRICHQNSKRAFSLRPRLKTNNLTKLMFNSSLDLSSHLALIIEERLYRRSLLNKISKLSNIKLISNKLVNLIKVAYGFECYTEYVDEPILTRLMVGADGANSLVRNLTNVGWIEKKYLHSAIVANFKCSVNHQNIAHQWFLANGDILACLPLFDNYISIVLSSSDCSKYLLDAGIDSYYKELNVTPKLLANLITSNSISTTATCLNNFIEATTQGIFGELELLNYPQGFPLNMGIANIGFNKNMVLIGDAFHTIHPLAGQGVNLGLGDAWELSAIIAEAPKIKIGNSALLQKYYLKRIQEVRQMQLICDVLYGTSQLASNNRYFERCLASGFRFLDKASWLTDFMIKFAV